MKELDRTYRKKKVFKREIKYGLRLLETVETYAWWMNCDSRKWNDGTK
jgi:hypothetical protein